MPGPRAVQNLQMLGPRDWQGVQMLLSSPAGGLGAGGIDWCITVKNAKITTEGDFSQPSLKHHSFAKAFLVSLIINLMREKGKILR